MNEMHEISYQIIFSFVGEDCLHTVSEHRRSS